MKRLILSLCLLLALLLGAARAEEKLYFHQINIGCADAYLVIQGETVILVDCGLDTDLSTATNEPLFTYLDASGIDHVDAYITTHFHNDHAYNLVELMTRYGTADTVIYGPADTLPERFSDRPCGTYQPMKVGDRATVGELELLCVGPKAVTDNGEKNTDSLNVLLTWKGRTFLFTGDYQNARAVQEYPDELKDIDVYSFPHHGLRPVAVTVRTLRHLNPKIIVVPGNMYAFVYRFCEDEVWIRPAIYTVADGNIVIVTDGETLETFLGVAPGEYPYQGKTAE